MKTVITSHHGLGDQVMLVPALRKYKNLHPDEQISLLTLERFGDTPKKLLSGLDYIKEVVPILPDAWNDFNTYESGVSHVIAKGKEYALEIGAEKVFPLLCNRYSDPFSIRNHKIFRFAQELSVTFSSLEEMQLQLKLNFNYFEAVGKILEKYQKPHIVLHLQGGNAPKSVSYQEFSYLWSFPGTIFEIGENLTSQQENHIPLGIPDMDFTKALVAQSDHIIAIDSIIMHLGFAFGKKMTAIFKNTPVIQVAPLGPELDNVTFTFFDRNLMNGMSSLKESVQEVLCQ